MPFNRMYDPDRMPNPVRGDLAVDHMDEQIPWMNHVIWAEDINDSHARVLKARYYGEISYIDECLGRILDAVEARGGRREHAHLLLHRPRRSPRRPSRLAEGELLRGVVPHPVPGELAGPPARDRRAESWSA